MENTEPSEIVAEFEKEFFSLQPVSRGKRFANLVIDMAVRFGFNFLLGIFSGFFGWGIEKNIWLNLTCSFSFIFIYYLLFEGMLGITVGKAVTKTKVVMEDGSPVTFNAAFIRTLCRFIPFEAFSFIGDDNPVGVHDSLSKTRVVSAVEEY